MQHWALFSYLSCLLVVHQWKPSLFSYMSLARFNMRWTLASPAPPLWAQTVSLLVDISLLPLLAHFFRCVFSQELLVPVLVRSYMKIAGYFFLSFFMSGWIILELEAKSCYSGICLVPSSHNPELHHLTVMAAKAVPDLQIHKTVKGSDCSSCGRERCKCWYKWPIHKQGPNVFSNYCKSCFYSLSVLRCYHFWDMLSRSNLQENDKLSLLQTSVLAA